MRNPSNMTVSIWRQASGVPAVARAIPAAIRRMSSVSTSRRRVPSAAVEELIPVAGDAGLSLTHMAMAFVIAHPGVTAAILGPRTIEQLDDLIAGADVSLSDDALDRIDAIVPPGTGVGGLQMGYTPSALTDPHLRRRPPDGRSAA